MRRESVGPKEDGDHPSTARGRAAALAAALACGVMGWGCADADPPPDPPPEPKVLAIGLDGIRPDVLAGVDTPHLDALANDGLYTPEARTGSPTVSGPGWSSFLIGVWPDKHGVMSNDFSSNRYDLHPDFLTRLEQVDPTFSTAAVVDWTPLGDSVDGGPLISPAVDSLVVLDGYELGWLEADSLSGDLAATILGSTEVDALFVYVGAADELSHQSAAIGAEYRGAIAAADRIVGRLMDAVRARSTYASEDWLVIVSSDHGRTEEGGHGGESEIEKKIPFLVSGPSVRGALGPDVAVVDVAVTALTHLGLTPVPEWDLDGRARGLADPPP